MKKTSSFLKKKGMMYLFAFIAIVIIGMYFYFSKSVKESFSDNNNDCVVRMFYVNWCGHCKKTKPDFQTFMEQNNNTTINGKKIKVEMIDCEENKQNADLASKFNVKGYPTIVAVVNGKPQEFSGSDRSVQGLNDWLKAIM
jgi:thiol-disulfide isomerase/thioredoxin